TLRLECEWAAPGQKHVTWEMDRDEICFFNLIDFVEKYGYTSIDYLYYKRTDGLVPIQLDTDVMEMLKEHETEKEVSLFMTKQRIATMAPSKSKKAPAKSASKNTKGQKGRKKKSHLNIIQTEAHYANDIEQQQDDDIQETPGGAQELGKRKGTVLTHVWNLEEGKRIVVKCNQLGQPIGKEGGLLGQFLGTIARNGGYCPVDINDWRKVKKDNAETMLQLIQTKFLYPRSCEKWILKSIGRDWRKYKSTLKNKLFNPKKKRSSLYKFCPDDVDQDQWNNIIKYWKSRDVKARSEKSKTAREMRKSTHSAGAKSYARWFEELRQADPAKRQPHRAEVYLATHRKRVQGTNDAAVQLENLIVKQPELAQSSDGRVAWEGDALHQVLGEEKPGSAHGMGLLPIPKQVYGRTTRHFKDINLATVEGSSSDLEAHMLEEIRQLKEHARKQDKIIDELKNKQRHEEREEPAMANLVSTDHGKFQKHVAHSKRKRVQYAVPNSGHAFCKERDELKKHTCETEYSDNDDDICLSSEKCLDDPCQDDPNYKELSHEAAEPTSSECSINQSRQKEFQVHKRNSSDGLKKRKVIKDQQGVLQETTAMTQQNITRDNTAILKGSKYMQPSIKVLSTVVLKSSNHRNKAIVAYANFLSSSPKANVGGVEIGKQFYKVRINHPTVQDEPLVRPIPGCKTIGDAHAKGVPIAWPSFCVEMING
ncbi:unnamed protein product, partial [Urochloa humidicola]